MMSTNIGVAARVQIGVDDFAAIATFNSLLDMGIPIPDELTAKVNRVVGERAFSRDPIILKQDYYEVDVKGKGDAMYGAGMIINVDDLPPNTVAIRVYAW